LKWEKVVRGEGLQNIERELQGEGTRQTIFIAWQLYLMDLKNVGLIV
jgi:hypothetical protein